jgi:hypothetical protein
LLPTRFRGGVESSGVEIYKSEGGLSRPSRVAIDCILEGGLSRPSRVAKDCISAYTGRYRRGLVNHKLQMWAFIINQVKGGLNKGKRQLTGESLAPLSTGGYASNSKIFETWEGASRA